jgi:Flp pilus assembly protein TadG
MASRLRSEDGVSGVIVAVAVVALLAMLGLSVDGGAFLLKRRAMVNATDAAALSYGISCIQGKTDATASSDATATATSNVSDATQVSKTGTCAAGKVTLTYQGNQPRYFLPVVGLSSTGSVSSTASAAWGGAGGSVTPPIEVTQGGLQNCNFPGYPGPPPPGPEPQCTLTFPKTGNGTWGGLNVTNQPSSPASCKSVVKLGWNVCAPPNSLLDVRALCSGMSAQEGKKAMDGNTAVFLNPSGTTWVCADQGQTDSIWMKFNDPGKVGQVFCFPLTDQTKVFPPAPASPIAYDVIAFVPLRVVQWFKQGNNLFLTLSWPGPQPCGIAGGGPPGPAYEIGLSG